MDESAGEGNGSVELFSATENSTFDFTKETWRDDVTFIVEEKRLYASKAVLAILSPVFESMFGIDFKEKTMKEVPLPGKKADDFLEFLNCLYPASEKSVTLENVFQVLPLADEYQVESLKIKCKVLLLKSIANVKISRSEILKFYNLASRYNLFEICKECIDILSNGHNSDCNFEVEKVMDKDTLLKFKTDIIAQQAKRLDTISTQFVKLTMKNSEENLDGFEGAAGIIIEHTADNVFDSTSNDRVFSKAVVLWNTAFRISTSVATKETRGFSDKYLSVFLHCNLPGNKWTCETKAVIVLENVNAVSNNIMTKKILSSHFKAPDSLGWGYEHFEKLSKFLTSTPKGTESYTGKITAYILAKQPTKIHDESQ